MDIIHGIRFKKFLEETKKELEESYKQSKRNKLHQKNFKRN
jgi:hypothetical protein